MGIRTDYERSHEWTDDDLREWFYWFHDRVDGGWYVRDDEENKRLVTNVEMSLYVHAAHVVRQDLQTAEEIAAFLKGTAHGERIENNRIS